MAVTGKELLRKLKAHGTGEKKLEVGRAVLRADPKATAAAVLAALEADAATEDAAVGPGTLAKAREIVATGDWTPPKTVLGNVEDEPDADEPAPVQVAPAAPVKADDKKKKPAAE